MHGASCTSKDFASVGWVLHFVNFGKFTVTYRDEIQQNISSAGNSAEILFSYLVWSGHDADTEGSLLTLKSSPTLPFGKAQQSSYL